MGRSRLVFFAVLSISLLFQLSARGARVRAQAADESEPMQEAQTHFDNGMSAYGNGDYATSLVEFQMSYELLAGHPHRAYVLFNIARANEALGRVPEAIEAYERFLAQTAADPNAPNRPEAERRLQELRLRERLERDRAQPQGAGAAGDRAQSAAASSGSASAPPPAAGGGLSLSPIGVTIGIVGLVAAAAGGVLGGVALAQNGDAGGQCAGTVCSPAGYAEFGDAHTLAMVSDGLLWPGLGVAAVGAILAFVLGGGDTQASAACDANGCGASVRGRF